MLKRTTSGAPVYSIFNKRTKLSPSEVLCDDNESERLWRIMAWNVAGLRAFVKCKELPAELASEFKMYEKILAVSQERNGGYAGVALLSKLKPIKVNTIYSLKRRIVLYTFHVPFLMSFQVIFKVWKGIGDPQFDGEGRLIIAEYPRFFFIGSYVPNSGRAKIRELDEKKPVIYGGDLNVAHNEIDLAKPDSNRNKTAGFTDQERQWFSTLLNAGFKDTYRTLHERKQEFTFWSFVGNARAKNIGWRLDYFVVSNRIMNKVSASEIRTDCMGSDHAPIILEIDM
uniref:exodeoxyribonuclease III n=1 Tax=Heterorhabditis bacteriophora TaxID=37862 RepID=A0A1I7XHD5_HETBA